MIILSLSTPRQECAVTCPAYHQCTLGTDMALRQDHPLEVQKLVHMGGSDLGSSRWSIAHSIAGKATVLFTLEIAGGEIFMVSSLWTCRASAVWQLLTRLMCVCSTRALTCGGLSAPCESPVACNQLPCALHSCLALLPCPALSVHSCWVRTSLRACRPNTERGSSSRTFVYDGACFTWRRRRSLTSGWCAAPEGCTILLHGQP